MNHRRKLYFLIIVAAASAAGCSSIGPKPWQRGCFINVKSSSDPEQSRLRALLKNVFAY
jgi:hypothetical protein